MRQSATVPFHPFLLPRKLKPLSSTFRKGSLGITVFRLQSHPVAFHRPVETLFGTVAHAAVRRFSNASIISTRSDISQSRSVTPAAIAGVSQQYRRSVCRADGIEGALARLVSHSLSARALQRRRSGERSRRRPRRTKQAGALSSSISRNVA